MPVGGPRHFSGKPDALGVATEWSCPTCRNKVTGRRLEEGCPHCGMGTSPLDQLAEATPEDGPADAKLLRQRGQQPQQGPIVLDADVPGVFDTAGLAPRYRWTTPEPPSPGAASTVYRLIEYTSTPGQEQALDDVLRRALVGTVGFAWGSIVAAIVDEVSTRQQDILTLAKRQPGVWLGGPAVGPPPTGMFRPGTHGHEILKDEVRTRMANTTPPPAPPDRPAPPDQGPSFTERDQLIAVHLIAQCGFRLAYTIALALQNFAQLADQEAMEPEKILRGEECLAVANAIMQEIPDDWAPEPEAAPDDKTGD